MVFFFFLSHHYSLRYRNHTLAPSCLTHLKCLLLPILFLSERKKEEGTNLVDEETKERPLGWRTTLPKHRRLPGADKVQTESSASHPDAEEGTGAAAAVKKKSFPFQRSAVLLSKVLRTGFGCLPSSRKKSMKWLSEIKRP